MHGDGFVESRDGVRIAFRDHGGEGRDLVLLHGAGVHLLSLATLVRKLQEDDTVGGPLRIVTMDSRWSGQSGDSDVYDWADLVADVDAVIDHLGLQRPVVAGHSWGGMIAVHHAVARPGVASAAINIDGQGSGDPTLYDDLDEVTYSRARAMQEAQVGALAAEVTEGDDEWRASVWEAARAATVLSGVPEDRADEFTERHFVRVDAGRWRRHPSPTMMSGLTGDLRLFDLYRRVECPLLIFNCTGTMPPGMMPPELEAMMAAYRRGLRRAFAALAEDRPNVSVVELPDAHHNAVLAGHAQETAQEVRAFLAAHP